MAKPSDNLIKQYRDKMPGAEDALARYLLATLPMWIRASFSQLTYQDVEDLTSLLAVHILTQIDMFHGRSNASFDTWARKVTRNGVYDWFAKENRRRGKEILVEPGDAPIAGSILDILQPRTPNPREAMNEKADYEADRELVKEFLERVKNPRQKLILEERFISGLSVAEIAERRGEKKRNKLDVLLWQAMQSLFKILKEMQSEGRLTNCRPRVVRRKCR